MPQAGGKPPIFSKKQNTTFISHLRSGSCVVKVWQFRCVVTQCPDRYESVTFSVSRFVTNNSDFVTNLEADWGWSWPRTRPAWEPEARMGLCSSLRAGRPETWWRWWGKVTLSLINDASFQRLQILTSGTTLSGHWQSLDGDKWDK